MTNEKPSSGRLKRLRENGPRERMDSLLRLSYAGAMRALAWPALKRSIRVETLSPSAKALVPRINAGAPTSNLDKSDSHPSLGTEFCQWSSRRRLQSPEYFRSRLARLRSWLRQNTSFAQPCPWCFFDAPVKVPTVRLRSDSEPAVLTRKSNPEDLVTARCNSQRNNPISSL